MFARRILYNTLILALTLNTEHYSAEYFIFIFQSYRDYVFKHFTSVFSSRGRGGGNLGVIYVRVCDPVF